MRLLFDEQLSPRLVQRLSDAFPGSAHVHDLHLGSADDVVVFEHARRHGLVVVTKDGDFADLAIARGAPPRVVWLRLGNCPTSAVEALLRAHTQTLAEFALDDVATILALADPGNPA